MTTSKRTATALIAPAAIASVFGIAALAQPPKVKFSVTQRHVDNNEGCAVGDINKDGHPDITAGEFWYEGSDFVQRPLRKILPFGADYTVGFEFPRPTGFGQLRAAQATAPLAATDHREAA